MFFYLTTNAIANCSAGCTGKLRCQNMVDVTIAGGYTLKQASHPNDPSGLCLDMSISSRKECSLNFSTVCSHLDYCYLNKCKVLPSQQENCTDLGFCTPGQNCATLDYAGRATTSFDSKGKCYVLKHHRGEGCNAAEYEVCGTGLICDATVNMCIDDPVTTETPESTTNYTTLSTLLMMYELLL
eukprot:GHVH01000025.1.p1 GENE.GHVH01000025.1~~GHVH01000025.1.p1  ORF type:complete len:184 (+),score=8.25 GHVH01000025.1:137-688(+)